MHFTFKQLLQTLQVRNPNKMIVCFLLGMFHPLFQSEKLKIKISEVEIWWVYFEMEMRWLYIHILCVHRHVCINYRK